MSHYHFWFLCSKSRVRCPGVYADTVRGSPWSLQRMPGKYLEKRHGHFLTHLLQLSTCLSFCTRSYI